MSSLAHLVSGGSTLASPLSSSPSPQQQSEFSSAAHARRREQLMKAGKIRPKIESVASIHAQIVVPKKRVEVPLHLYLIEQAAPVVRAHTDTQTDDWMEEEAEEAPSFVARKHGVDMWTQVETHQVFDFDSDVAQILEVVVSKTLEQACTEVREEEELTEIDAHRAQLTEKARREEAKMVERLRGEQSLYAEKERGLASARRRAVAERAVRAKLASSFFARSYLGELVERTFTSLIEHRHFTDTTASTVEHAFLPHLTHKTEAVLAHQANAAALVNDLLRDGTRRLETSAREVLEARRQAEEAARKAAAEAAAAAAELARRRAPLQLEIALLGGDLNAPIVVKQLTGESSIADIEAKVYEWMQNNMPDDAVPPRDTLKFLWNGEPLDLANTTAVYDMGINNNPVLSVEMLKPVVEEQKEEDAASKRGGDEKDGEEDDEEENSTEGEASSRNSSRATSRSNTSRSRNKRGETDDEDEE